MSVPQILRDGLPQLRSGSYDGLGAILWDGERLHLHKALDSDTLWSQEPWESEGDEQVEFLSGLAHLRRATHAPAALQYTHPLLSSCGTFALVHNGLIENARDLSRALRQLGVHASGEHDSSLVLALMERLLLEGLSLREAFYEATSRIRGSYAFTVITESAEEHFLIRSQASAVFWTRTDLTLHFNSDRRKLKAYGSQNDRFRDGELAVISQAAEIDYPRLTRKSLGFLDRLDECLADLELDNYPAYFLKEVHDQGQAVEDAIRGRIRINPRAEIQLGGLRYCEHLLTISERGFIFCSSETLQSARIGKRLIEKFARFPIEVILSEQYEAEDLLISPADVVFVIDRHSASENMLRNLRKAQDEGALIYGISRNPGSELARLVDAGSYTHGGIERGLVASKTIPAEISVFAMLALEIGRLRNVQNDDSLADNLEALSGLGNSINKCLERADSWAMLASRLAMSRHVHLLCKANSIPIGLEGQKLFRCISDLDSGVWRLSQNSQGNYSWKEAVAVVLLDGTEEEKELGNIQLQMRQQNVQCYYVCTDPQSSCIMGLQSIAIPKVAPILQPVLQLIPLQILAYHVAALKGLELDTKPVELSAKDPSELRSESARNTKQSTKEITDQKLSA